MQLFFSEGIFHTYFYVELDTLLKARFPSNMVWKDAVKPRSLGKRAAFSCHMHKRCLCACVITEKKEEWMDIIFVVVHTKTYNYSFFYNDVLYFKTL